LYFEKYGCQSCHIIGGQGGYVGPPLDGAGKRLQPDWAFNWLKDPQKFKSVTLEPRSGMSDDEAKAVTAFLMNLK
jgi:cytochrome c1